MQNESCPMCRDGVLTASGGRLDQSGESYLPTVVWSCARCGYTRYEAAVHARWQASFPPATVLVLPLPRRRAA